MTKLKPVFWGHYQIGLWLNENVYPHCVLCRHYPKAGIKTPIKNQMSHFLCIACHQAISWLPKAFDVELTNYIPVGSTPNNQLPTHLSIQPICYYQYPISQAIVAFKYQEDLTKLPILIHALKQLPLPDQPLDSVIIPMPTTAKRLKKRGFDPVSILVSHLSKHWQIPIWREIYRIDDTVSQQGLSRIERLKNINNAFLIKKRPPVNHLILFDDVSTTGTSLKELAMTIYQAYPHLKISAYCLAHGNQMI